MGGGGVKKPNCPEANQLAIYKRDWRVNLEALQNNSS